MTWFVILVATLAAAQALAEIDASRDTMPDKFKGAPGLIKGGFLIEGSKKRFEGANELNLDALMDLQMFGSVQLCGGMRELKLHPGKQYISIKNLLI